MSKHLQYAPEYLRENPPNEAVKFFLDEYAKGKPGDRRCLEIGTLRWFANSTHHRALIDPTGEDDFIMTDIGAGEDVDIVADAHELRKTFLADYFDGVWTSSTFEHLHSPWIAAEQILDVLKPHGVFFIQTHLCFPEHGYPNDFFRYTRQGLERLFKRAKRVVSCYDFPATLTPHLAAIDWNTAAPNHLNVCIAGVK